MQLGHVLPASHSAAFLTIISASKPPPPCELSPGKLEAHPGDTYQVHQWSAGVPVLQGEETKRQPSPEPQLSTLKLFPPTHSNGQGCGQILFPAARRGLVASCRLTDKTAEAGRGQVDGGLRLGSDLGSALHMNRQAPASLSHWGRGKPGQDSHPAASGASAKADSLGRVSQPRPPLQVWLEGFVSAHGPPNTRATQYTTTNKKCDLGASFGPR